MMLAPEELLDCIDRGRPEQVLDLVAAQLDRGATVTELVTGALAPAQSLVGQRWHAAEYSITQEHVASAMIEDALGLLSAHTPREATRGRIALVCAAGEWHTTPARMAALGLRDAGWKVDFLGGSTPPEHLATTLQLARPSFLAISTTLPLALAGVPPMVATAHELDIPVLVGGRAFGPDDRRARALGADGHAPDLPTADLMLSTWMDAPPPCGQPTTRDDVRKERAALAARRGEVVADTYDRLARTLPSMSDYDHRQREHTRRDLDYTVRFLDVALLVDDPALFTEYVGWLERLLAHRGIPGDVVAHSLEAFLATIDPDLPRARDLLDLALDART